MAEAEACWRRILTLKRPNQFCRVDQGIYGHLTLRSLAVPAEERGDRDRKRPPTFWHPGNVGGPLRSADGYT